MDRKYKRRIKHYPEEVDCVLMEETNGSDDSVFFSIDEAEWGDVPTSPLAATNPRSYNRHEYMSSASQTSYSNIAFQDFQRQESNIHARFDGDTVYLFSTHKKRRSSIRKRLAIAWCSACMFQLWHFLRSASIFDCSCRDQTGVHCLHKFKQKALKKLKVLQGILCLVTVIQSGMVFFPLGNVTSEFDGQCLLYSNLFIQWISKNDTVALDLSRSKFGTKEDCNFTTFINVVVAITGLFFIWFFIHSSYVSGLEQIEMKLQLPFLICYLILLVSVIVSSFKITIGFNYWCHNIIINNQMKRRLECKDFEKLKWSTSNRSNFYTYFALAEISSWILTFTLIIQLSVNALHLYQNFRAIYEVIEVTHAKLHESDISDEEEGWELVELNLTPRRPAPALPVYKVEYMKHQVLAKVVEHNDSPFKSIDPLGPLVLDKEKFKRSFSSANLKSRRKVDFPLRRELGTRTRQNWTGSCEELGSKREYEDRIKKHWALRSHEWHGFDTVIGENASFGQSFDWHADFGSKIQKIWSGNSFEWPATNENSEQDITSQVPAQSFEWHGFESNFVSPDVKTSFSLPSDWQKFDMNLESQSEQLDWPNQELQSGNQKQDPWTFEDNRHDPESTDSFGRQSDCDSEKDLFSCSKYPFDSDNR